jgi:SAM-dependent methyltransferase
MPEWWDGFFDGLMQDVQLGLWTDDQDNRASAEKIERAIGLHRPAPVLDVPCGEGRISIELAARGHDVTGVDLNERFLADGRRKAQERGLSIRWERRDMRDLYFESEFEAVLNFGGSFGYFDEDDNARVVAGVRRALRPGGRFLIDVPTTETIFPRFRERLWSTSHGFVVLNENRFDHESGRVEGDWTIVAPDGRRESLHSSIRLYTYRELVDQLRAAGFADVEGFDAANLEPFALGASRLLLVATKD